MTASQSGIEIRDWTALAPGLYRFHGADRARGGFYADARLEHRGTWRATIEAKQLYG